MQIIIRDYLRVISRFNLNVKLLLFRTFLVSLYTGIYGIIFNLYILELGYPVTFLGLVLALHTFALSTASIPAGILCDRMDRKTLMVVSGLLLVIATLPMYLTTSPYVMIFSPIATGIFISVAAVCVTPMLAENSSKENIVHVYSINATLGWVASIAGCAVGGFVPGLWRQLSITGNIYQMTLIASVLLLAIGWLLMLVLRNNNAERITSDEPFSLKNIRISRDVSRFVITCITFGIGSGMIVPYFNIYFLNVLKVGVFEIGLASAFAGGFMMFGLIINPYLASRIGKVRSAVVTKVISVPFLILMAITTNFVVASCSYIFYMFFINMAGPATTSFQMEQIHPREHGLALGLMSTGTYLAISASTYISGILIENGNYLLTFLGTCGGYILTAILLFHYFRDREKEHVGSLGFNTLKSRYNIF
ncbi:MFS transporter [Methanooceanicella nereidis]|uniref:MFS transporter n=1 Tax=Methanooceanicella nereidis TaxID=2052831 RepID=UPI001E341B39|nr:MFS transporter [Methanocella sp. CWC-04]